MAREGRYTRRMRQNWIIALTIAASVGSGVIGGLLFAFSTSVMRALGRQPVAHAIATMQAINVVILNPVFLLAFMGTAVVCLLTLVAAWLTWDRPGALWLLAGSALYLVGAFGITAAINVPLNDQLAVVTADASDAEQQWVSYSSKWTVWNHVRAAAAIAAAGSFAMALRS